ncbi:prolyl-tRNA synthetase associated domain-containing protein [uncultured Lactobacillus sp.]|uniref:prolyl-tRNA synthetase associated domain-containing protein n=1 Tax=uncultured Lactobacillus sp. TaxID=153152 RepID=UPI002803788B|nr:prolyl-tRNA synthetase associated domain-containing protein [uncultured Lactobacillus sp.]
MNKQEILQKLDEEKIDYQVVNHPAVFTSEEADKYVKGYEFGRVKNLFLRTANKKHYYLVLIDENDRLDFKHFRDIAQTSRVSMASSDELEEKLGVTPGSVSPFGLLNNEEKDVELDVQKKILKDEYIGVHPNDNTATVILKTEDLIDFLKNNGFEIRVLDL